MQSEILRQKIAEKNARITELQKQLEATKSNAMNQVMDAQQHYDDLSKKYRDELAQSQSEFWLGYFEYFVLLPYRLFTYFLPYS